MIFFLRTKQKLYSTSKYNNLHLKILLWSEYLCLPNIHMLKSYPPKVVAFGRCLGHESGTLMDLIKEIAQNSLAPPPCEDKARRF